MKHYIRALIVTLAVAVSTIFITKPILAAELPSAVIAIVDTQKIRRESLAGKDFSRQVEVIRAEFQAEYNKITENLKNQEAELQRQRAILSQEAFEEKRRSFAQKYQVAQQNLEEKQQSINLAINKASNELTRALLPIFRDVAEENGATILLERSQIVLPAPQLDITDEVITRLDKVLPSIDVDTSKVP